MCWKLVSIPFIDRIYHIKLGFCILYIQDFITIKGWILCSLVINSFMTVQNWWDISSVHMSTYFVRSEIALLLKSALPKVNKTRTINQLNYYDRKWYNFYRHGSSIDEYVFFFITEEYPRAIGAPFEIRWITGPILYPSPTNTKLLFSPGLN